MVQDFLQYTTLQSHLYQTAQDNIIYAPRLSQSCTIVIRGASCDTQMMIINVVGPTSTTLNHNIQIQCDIHKKRFHVSCTYI